MGYDHPVSKDACSPTLTFRREKIICDAFIKNTPTEETININVNINKKPLYNELGVQLKSPMDAKPKHTSARKKNPSKMFYLLIKSIALYRPKDSP